MDLESLRSHSARLFALERALENYFHKTLSEVQSLRRKVDNALQNNHPAPPHPIHPMRSDSPLVFQPLTPAPRTIRSGPRRVRSSVLLGKVWFSFQRNVSRINILNHSTKRCKGRVGEKGG